MFTKTPAAASDELALELIAILGLPQNVAKFSLQFEARKAIVAEVTFYPDSASELMTTTRFSCTPIDEAVGKGA